MDAVVEAATGIKPDPVPILSGYIGWFTNDHLMVVLSQSPSLYRFR